MGGEIEVKVAVVREVGSMGQVSISGVRVLCYWPGKYKVGGVLPCVCNGDELENHLP